MALCDLQFVLNMECNIAVGAEVNHEIYPDGQMDGRTRRERINVIKLNCFWRQIHTHRQTSVDLSGNTKVSECNNVIENPIQYVTS